MSAPRTSPSATIAAIADHDDAPLPLARQLVRHDARQDRDEHPARPASGSRAPTRRRATRDTDGGRRAAGRTSAARTAVGSRVPPRPSRLVGYGSCSRRCRTSPRGATQRASPRSATPSRARAALLDVHSDADHHRSVFTLAGRARTRSSTRCVAGVAARASSSSTCAPTTACTRGSAPSTSSRSSRSTPPSMARPTELRSLSRERIGGELGLPVFLYGRSAAGRRPAFFRRGGLARARRAARVRASSVPDFGPAQTRPARRASRSSGRETPLVAYNLDLGDDELGVAHEIARAVRESSGGLPGVQAIGLQLPRAGRIQVSMNVLDLERARCTRSWSVSSARRHARRAGARRRARRARPRARARPAEAAGVVHSRGRRVARPRARARGARSRLEPCRARSS